MGMSMEMSIGDDSSNLEALSQLFAQGLTSQYISHSELQGYRATSPGRWAKNIRSILRDEIRARLKQPRRSFPRYRNWRGVVQALEGQRLVGIALITISRDSVIPYGVIEDIVIDKEKRSGGRGEAILQWITNQMLNAGITRLFLESGVKNERAHHLFENLGFKPVSVVMMRELRSDRTDPKSLPASC
jgi:GNAT superfamily N-acetyltransferase